MKYICKFCGKELSSARSLGGHITCCGNNPNRMTGKKKDFVKKIPLPSEYNTDKDDLFCQYCEKQCKNLNSLKQHEIRCKENPNKLQRD